MGTFPGHVLPGTFFLLFGVWWTVRITWRYLASSRSNPYKNLIYQPVGCGRFKNWPFESVVKIICSIIGFVAAIYASHGKSDHVVANGGSQATIYAFFMLSGIVDILVYHRFIPPGSDYITATLAFTTEGILLAYPVPGGNHLQVLVYRLLAFAIAGCVITILLEMRYPRNVVGGLSRTFMVLLQGTWLWHTAFLLYNPNQNSPPPHKQDHGGDTILIYTMIFTWHFGAIFVTMVALGFLTRVCYFRSCKSCIRPSTRRDDIEYRPLILEEASSANKQAENTGFDASPDQPATEPIRE